MLYPLKASSSVDDCNKRIWKGVSLSLISYVSARTSSERPSQPLRVEHACKKALQDCRSSFACRPQFRWGYLGARHMERGNECPQYFTRYLHVPYKFACALLQRTSHRSTWRRLVSLLLRRAYDTATARSLKFDALTRTFEMPPRSKADMQMWSQHPQLLWGQVMRARRPRQASPRSIVQRSLACWCWPLVRRGNRHSPPFRSLKFQIHIVGLSVSEASQSLQSEVSAVGCSRFARAKPLGALMNATRKLKKAAELHALEVKRLKDTMNILQAENKVGLARLYRTLQACKLAYLAFMILFHNQGYGALW